MKRFLITLSSIATLTLTSNSIINTVDSNMMLTNQLSINNCSLSLGNKSSIENKLNYKWNDSYNWFFSISNNYSDPYKIVKWTDYAKDWNTFTSIYSTFNFDSDSYLKVSTASGKEDNKCLNSQVTTTKIKVAQAKDVDNSLFEVSINTWPGYGPNNPGGTGTAIEFYLAVWHDDNNIYWKWHISTVIFLGSTSYSNIKLNNITFNNN